MDILINNIKINKADLLNLIAKSKLKAIKTVRAQTGISLKNAKDIVENLDKDSGFYDHKNFEVEATANLKPKLASIARKRKGSHFIKKSNTKLYVSIGVLVLCLVLYKFL